MQRSEDGMTIRLAGRPLRFLDTPGHARHHHCIWDERSAGFFTGDTFGISYREFDTPAGPWLIPTTTPVQFEPEPMRRSVQRMLEYAPRWLYPTHYGRIGGSAEEVQRLASLMLQQMDAMVALALALAPALPDDAERHAAMMRGFRGIHLASLRAQACTLSEARIDELLVLDAVLNVQGMGVWLERRKR